MLTALDRGRAELARAFGGNKECKYKQPGCAIQLDCKPKIEILYLFISTFIILRSEVAEV
jgi:hypothetical protein